MWWPVSEHIIQLSFMAAIVFGSQAFSRRAHNVRVRREAQRLRSAMAIGLPALRKLYEDNLSILSGRERPLISGRNQINLLRTQLGRLTSLDPSEIEAIMAASFAAERAETDMAIAGKKIGDFAFTIPENNEAKGILTSTLEEVCSMLRNAEELLNPNGMPRLETASDVPPIREPDADDVCAHARARDLGNAVQLDKPHREQAKLGELQTGRQY
jgi:hypothetical protein